MIEAGQKAPAFSGKTTTGETIRLSEFKGSRVALYFYPKDNTPGCTNQACSIRDGKSALKKAGIIVIGVSPDSLESHQKFADKHDLTHHLIADTERKVIEKYGVWGEKKLYGRTFMGLKRTTFLIDEQGKVVQVIKRPDTKDHASEIIRKFDL